VRRHYVAVILLLLVVSGVAAAGTGERMAAALQSHGLSRELIVFMVAMLPIVELRGALPIGINLFGLGLWKTLVLAVAGNMAPILIVVLLLDKLTVLLSRVRVFKRFFDWLFARTRARSGVIARYEFWGLAIFVGIPLPGTGAWTGAVAAVLMGLPYWRALLSILLGVLMAAAVVAALCLLGKWGAILAGLALLLVLAQGAMSIIRARKNRTT
jgi:uncharacterized membrane protein